MVEAIFKCLVLSVKDVVENFTNEAVEKPDPAVV